MNNNKIWRIQPPSPYASQFALETGITPLKAQLLINRGISDKDSAVSFLSPRLTDLLDPMLLKDMDKAVEDVLHSIDRRENIAVYGDYDADGITATAVLLNFFSSMNIKASSYIPDRLEEGYGLNMNAIKKLSDRGVNLLITVDCGIANTKEIEFAQSLGMKVVVTDHHQIPKDFEPVCPVINPNRPDSLFPFRELAGVGVAFFLAVAIRSELRNRNRFSDIPEPDLKKYLDLVAIGTVGDMVPLAGQNRIITLHGIEAMKKTVWPGIRAMNRSAGVDGKSISSYDLAFRLAPRLNAPGRMGDINAGLLALTTASDSVASEMAGNLNNMNTQRQSIEGEILNEIEETIIPKLDLENRKIIILAKAGWHKGVMGIVASRLLERHRRPCLLFSIDGDKASGSGRSIDGFNLFKALSSMGHLLERFGGHYHAAGCTVKTSDIDEFQKGMEKLALEELREEDIVPSLRIDAEIALSDLTLESVSEIRSLEPFGSGNPDPLFYSEGLMVLDSRVVGEKHLILRVKQGTSILDAMGFNLFHLQSLKQKTINLVHIPEINAWNGNKKIRLKIVDLEIKGETTKLVRNQTKMSGL
jgi:single-stranded-DNA-specific exonuclease